MALQTPYLIRFTPYYIASQNSPDIEAHANVR